MLARLRSRCPEVSTHTVVTSVHENHPMESFFDEVTETALVVATDYNLDMGVGLTWKPTKHLGAICGC